MFREKKKKTSATRRRRRRRDGSGRARRGEDVARRAERRARASERTRVEGALPRSGEETKGGLVRVPSRMSSARASAAEVGIFAAGPDTPTLWPLRRRISSVVPTLVPRRVIIARARRLGRNGSESRARRARRATAVRRVGATTRATPVKTTGSVAWTKMRSQTAVVRHDAVQISRTVRKPTPRRTRTQTLFVR